MDGIVQHLEFLLQSIFRVKCTWNIEIREKLNILNIYLFLDSCKGVQCYNGGKCDTDTGKCNCSKTAYLGEKCEERKPSCHFQ